MMCLCFCLHVLLAFLQMVMSSIVETFHRMKQTSENFETVNKILNGGGTLSVELIENATKLFPRAMLLTAYGMFYPDLFYYNMITRKCMLLRLKK